MISDLQQTSIITFVYDLDSKSVIVQLDGMQKNEISKIFSIETMQPSFIMRKDFPILWFYTSNYEIGILSGKKEVLIMRDKTIRKYEINTEQSRRLEELCEELLSSQFEKNKSPKLQ